MVTDQRFASVVDEHRHRIYTLAYYSLRRREDAEDVTQEVFVRLWSHWDELDPDHVEGWLIRVTSNACVDLVRKRRNRRELAGAEATEEMVNSAIGRVADPSAPLQSAETQAEVQDALARLKEPYRSIVILREIQGLSYERIGAALDLPLNTVKVYLHRGRKMLADRLRPVDETQPGQPEAQARHV